MIVSRSWHLNGEGGCAWKHHCTWLFHTTVPLAAGPKQAGLRAAVTLPHRLGSPRLQGHGPAPLQDGATRTGRSNSGPGVPPQRRLEPARRWANNVPQTTSREPSGDKGVNGNNDPEKCGEVCGLPVRGGRPFSGFSLCSWAWLYDGVSAAPRIPRH